MVPLESVYKSKTKLSVLALQHKFHQLELRRTGNDNETNIALYS